MEFLIWVVLGGIALFFWGVVGIGARAGKLDKEAATNADALTAKLFNGDPQVSYWRGLGGLTDEALLKAAGRHGYQLTTKETATSGTTLIFTRVAQSSSRTTKASSPGTPGSPLRSSRS